jgi:hypothetical protein
MPALPDPFRLDWPSLEIRSYSDWSIKDMACAYHEVA